MSKFAQTFLKSLNEENEKLHGKQGNIDVAPPHGKITGADFAALRKKKGLKKEETEGDAFGKAVQDAKAAGKKPGDKFKVGDKEYTLQERHMSSSEKKKAKKLHKKLPTNAFTKQYGKKEGKKIKYATATKMAMKESIGYEAAPAADAEMSDEEAYRRTLDKGTNPSEFDVADNPQLNVDASGVEAARNWITKLEEMAEFVNGTGPESLNSQINQLEIKNSVPFRGVVRREEKRITKLAENLRGLAEVFKSVVITSEKKVKDATTPR